MRVKVRFVRTVVVNDIAYEKEPDDRSHERFSRCILANKVSSFDSTDSRSRLALGKF